MTPQKSTECEFWLGCENEGEHEVTLSVGTKTCKECGNEEAKTVTRRLCDEHVEGVVGLPPKELAKAYENKPVTLAKGGN